MSVASNTSAVLAAIEPDAPASVRRRRWRAYLATYASALLIYMFAAAAGLLDLWLAGRTEQWGIFWTSAIIFAIWAFIPSLFFLNPALRGVTSSDRLKDTAKAMRDLAAQGDDRTVPPVLIQPVPLTGADAPAGSVRLGPLRPFPIRNSGASTQTFFALIFLLVVAAWALLLAAGTSGKLGIINGSWIGSVPCTGALVLAIVGAVLAGRRARRHRLYVTVDAGGVQAERYAGRRHLHDTPRVSWNQVRSLSRAALAVLPESGTTVGQPVYLLESPDSHLMWTVDGSEQSVMASECLLRQVVTHTSQPLRDLSNLAAELGRDDGTASRVVTNQMPAGQFLILPQQAARRAGRVWVGIQATCHVCIAGVLTAALVLAGTQMQTYQSQYLAGLPQLVHSTSGVLFFDPLAVPDGNWDVVSPSSQLPYTAVYTAHSYQLGGPQAGSNEYQLEPQSFGDAAYEVTVTLRGKSTSTFDDAVGIALHATPGAYDMLIFYVDQQGAWTFSNYRYAASTDNAWTELASGTSSAIRTRVGDANRLLVITHGDSYRFFVNDEEVGSYKVRASDHLPSSGTAGVYLDDTEMTGVFTQFTVYSVPPSGQWAPLPGLSLPVEASACGLPVSCHQPVREQ